MVAERKKELENTFLGNYEIYDCSFKYQNTTSTLKKFPRQTVRRNISMCLPYVNVLPKTSLLSQDHTGSLSD